MHTQVAFHPIVLPNDLPTYPLHLENNLKEQSKIILTWQLRMTLDSLCNSCHVSNSIDPGSGSIASWNQGSRQDYTSGWRLEVEVNTARGLLED